MRKLGLMFIILIAVPITLFQINSTKANSSNVGYIQDDLSGENVEEYKPVYANALYLRSVNPIPSVSLTNIEGQALGISVMSESQFLSEKESISNPDILYLDKDFKLPPEVLNELYSEQVMIAVFNYPISKLSSIFDMKEFQHEDLRPEYYDGGDYLTVSAVLSHKGESYYTYSDFFLVNDMEGGPVAQIHDILSQQYLHHTRDTKLNLEGANRAVNYMCISADPLILSRGRNTPHSFLWERLSQIC